MNMLKKRVLVMKMNVNILERDIDKRTFKADYFKRCMTAYHRTYPDLTKRAATRDVKAIIAYSDNKMKHYEQYITADEWVKNCVAFWIQIASYHGAMQEGYLRQKRFVSFATRHTYCYDGDLESAFDKSEGII